VVLSRREKYITAAAGIAVAILFLDRAVLTPLQERAASRSEETARRVREIEQAGMLFDRMRHLSGAWQEIQSNGLKSDAGEAEIQVLHAVRNWAQESGLALSGLRPESVKQRGALDELTFRASGTGTIQSVAGFLWRLESAPIPIRVTDLQLGSRKEAADDLSLQLRLSTLAEASVAVAQEPVRDGETEND